jgi:peroxiredoxin
MDGPAVGASAPDFELRDAHRSPVRLSAACAAGPVLLVFFPHAFTEVCGGELTALQRALPDLVPAQVLAVSTDPPYALRVWADSAGFEFPLLSDFWPHGAVAQAYGVLDAERGAARRASFLLDTSHTVRWTVRTGTREPRPVDEYRRAVRALAGWPEV